MLHEITRHIYKFTKKLFGLQVLTENGFEDIESVNITDPVETVTVITKYRMLKCSKKHILITDSDEEVYAGESIGKNIKTLDGIETVLKVENSGTEELYDISLKADTSHRYYANGMLSHNCVIMDEAAFVPNNIASRVFESIYPVISSSKTSQFIMVSTPNGADPNNLYYSIWQKANLKTRNKDEEAWKAFRFDWWDVPGRDEQWKNMTVASIGARRFAQEFGNEFLSNSNSRKLIPDDIIEKYRMRLSEYRANGIKAKTQRLVSENQNRLYEFQMWHEFDARRTYCASADIAEGVGSDASVLYIWDVTDTSNIRQCAKFSSNRVSLVEFAYICSKMLALYGNPYLFAERNGLSAGMIDALRITYGYENVACESKNGEAGIYSHVTVKLKACLWARDMLTMQGFGFTIYDKDLLDEMATFVKRDGKSDKTMYAALSPAHDDHMMSFVWACWALNAELVEKYFVVGQYFVNMYEQHMPKTVLPMSMYTEEMLRSIHADPIYQDFMEFKARETEHNRKLTEIFENEDRNDVFQYQADPYFGNDGSSDWGSPWDLRPIRQNAMPQTINANNRMPAYFI